MGWFLRGPPLFYILTDLKSWELAEEEGLKGKVYVTFTLSKDGQITNIKISKSSDFDKLDEGALKILADIKTIEPIPKELNKNSWEITVPIVYQIK